MVGVLSAVGSSSCFGADVSRLRGLLTRLRADLSEVLVPLASVPLVAHYASRLAGSRQVHELVVTAPVG